MNNSESIKLHWPPACVGCGATTDLQSESIGNKYGAVQICMNCIGIARLEQLLNKGWKIAIALFSHLLMAIMFLFFGNEILQSFFFGLTIVIPILLIEGVIGAIKYSESFIEIKQDNHIIFRDSLFTNLFASSNPNIEAEFDLSFHFNEAKQNPFGSTILYFLLLMTMSLSFFISQSYLPSAYFSLTFGDQLILIGSAISILGITFFIGIFSFYFLLSMWKKKMTAKFPCEKELPDLSLHAPSLRTGPISSKSDSTFGQNVAVDLGQKSIMEKIEDAIQGGDFTDAVRLCRKAIDIDPLNIEAWKFLAIAHAKSGKCIESRDTLQRARDLAKDPKLIESTLNECKKHCGDIFDLPPSEMIPLAPVTPTIPDEVAEYRRQIDENPMIPETWVKMATVLARSGRCVDARDALQRAKDIDPKESMIENAMKTCKECCKEEFSNFEI